MRHEIKAIVCIGLLGCAGAPADDVAEPGTLDWDALEQPDGLDRAQAAPGDLTLTLVDGNNPGLAAEMLVSGATPGAAVGVTAGTLAGPGPCPSALGGLCVDIVDAVLSGKAKADAKGEATIYVSVPGVAVGDEVLYQAFEPNGADTSSSDVLTTTTEERDDNNWHGVANFVEQTDLTDWTECYADLYGDSGTGLPSIWSGACTGAELMLACRETGSGTLLTAAYASRDDVLHPTGTGNTTWPANGVGWYYDSSYSLGFAPAFASVSRNSCDTEEARGGASSAQRLCWHTFSGNLDGGWRCGGFTDLNFSVDYERVVLQRG